MEKRRILMEIDNTYRPLPYYLTIRESDIEGLGLFTTQIINKGKNIGLSHIKDDEHQHGLIRTPLGGFVNHSENSNCELIDIGPNVFLLAKKDIMPDEELTLTYRTYEV